MRTSAPGSPERSRARGSHGFTLLELLVVVTLIALATTGVSLALRDGPDRGLEREAQRLSAVLTAAHAQARLRGVPLTWQAGEQGFDLDGQFQAWAQPGVRVSPNQLTLGPEPLLPPTRIALSLGDQTTWLGTDGLRPFAPAPAPDATP
jgi:general secretion pathway protein H